MSSTRPANHGRVQAAGDGAGQPLNRVFERHTFEWDVKRLAASFAVAGRDNGFAGKARRKIVLAAAESYRTAMRGFAGQPFLAVWYAHLDIEEAIGQFRSQFKAKKFKATEELLAKAHTKDSTQALRKLTTVTDGRRRIISDPPMIVPVEEVFADVQVGAIYQQVRGLLGKYRRSLQSDRCHLLEEFTLVQVARKVVGVGSVGTRAWVLLMDAGDGDEPLFCRPRRPSRRSWRSTAAAASTPTRASAWSPGST